MATTVERSKPPTSDEAIAEVEKKFGIVLPDQYRLFLLRQNGGKPRPAHFKFKNASGPYTDSSVEWFLSIYDGEYSNFVTYFTTYKVDQVRLPDPLIPIAYDAGGNLICISHKGKDRGAIYFWDHENEATGNQRPSYDNVSLVADDFNSFLDELSA